MATLGIDFGVSKMTVGDHNVKVNIFDMAGQPFFFEVRNYTSVCTVDSLASQPLPHKGDDL